MKIYSIPLRTRFRGVDVREGVLPVRDRMPEKTRRRALPEMTDKRDAVFARRADRAARLDA